MEQATPAADELVDICVGDRTVVVVATAEGEPRLTDGLARLAYQAASRCRPWNSSPPPTTSPAPASSTSSR